MKAEGTVGAPTCFFAILFFFQVELSRGGSPLVLFDNFIRKGVSAVFRKEDEDEKAVFTITGQSGRYISDHFARISKQYKLPVKISQRRIKSAADGSPGSPKTVDVVNMTVGKGIGSNQQGRR
jgi:hypothetical protein